MKLALYLNRFLKNNLISNVIIVHPMRAELLHVDRQTDRHDEAISQFHNFANAPTN